MEKVISVCLGNRSGEFELRIANTPKGIRYQAVANGLVYFEGTIEEYEQVRAVMMEGVQVHVGAKDHSH